MSTMNKLMFQAAGVLTMGVISLATAPAANARADGYGCGVCYEEAFCSGNRSGDCQQLCGAGATGECVYGIPGGWMCEGSGVYASFTYCGVGV